MFCSKTDSGLFTSEQFTNWFVCLMFGFNDKIFIQ